MGSSTTIAVSDEELAALLSAAEDQAVELDLLHSLFAAQFGRKMVLLGQVMSSISDSLADEHDFLLSACCLSTAIADGGRTQGGTLQRLRRCCPPPAASRPNRVWPLDMGS